MSEPQSTEPPDDTEPDAGSVAVGTAAPSASSAPPAGPTVLDRLREPRVAVWILPVVVGVLVLVLSVLGISGSSVPQLSPEGSSDGSVIVNQSRSVRSDEWLVRTPFLVGQERRGFEREADVGIGTHDMSVLSDLPVLDWPALFRPHQVALFVAPVANGFAFEWWSSAAILVLGVYVFLLVVVRDWRWAAAGALVLYGSPFLHWWYAPTTFAVVGWAAIAFAALLSALSSDMSGWHRWWRVGLAAYAAACFGLFLYPPSQIPVMLAFGAASVGVVAQRWLSGQVQWRRLLLNLAVAGAGALVVLGAFVITRRPALTAIANTVYPGLRRTIGGEGNVGSLANGWWGWSYVRDDLGLRGVLYPNESEASSFLFLGLYLLAALPLVWGAVLGVGRRMRLPMIALLVTIAVMLYHVFVGLPSVVARVTLLDRVPEQRLLIGLGVAAMLVLVLVGTALGEASPARWRRVAGGIVVVAVGASMVKTLGDQYVDAGAPFGTKAVLFTVALVAVPAALYFWRPLLSVGVLAVIGLSMSVTVNPLTKGLGPLVDNQFVTDVRAISEESGDGGWVTTDWGLSAMLTADGRNNVSAVNLYPDADAWRVLDPSGVNEDVWNRYAHTAWSLEPGLGEPKLTLRQADVVGVAVDPCGPELAELGVRYVVTRSALEAPCLVLDRTSELAGDVFVYQRSGGS